MDTNVKRKQFNKIAIILICLISILFVNYTSVFAVVSTEQTVPEIYSPACILINVNSGRILYEKNANEKMYPASTTKLMTAILTVENCNLTDVVTIKQSYIDQVPPSYKLSSFVHGEQLTVENLLNLLLIPSTNDSAFALAEHIGGSTENFAEMMNNRAKELGCTNTHFVNPNGIHSDDHYTTAHDLALIGLQAMKYDVIRKITSSTTYTLPITNKYNKADRVFKTTVELLKPNSKYYYEYATGLKTGYTDPAQNCIVATAKKDDVELLCVVLHGVKLEDGSSGRDIDCKTLFEYGFNNFSLEKIAKTNDIVDNITIKNGTLKTRKLDVILSENVYGFLNNDTNISEVEKNIEYTTALEAPITANQELGTIAFRVNDTTYFSKVYASHDVQKIDWIKIGIWIALILIILILLRIIVKSLHSSRRKYSKQNRNISHTDYYYKHKSKH